MQYTRPACTRQEKLLNTYTARHQYIREAGVTHHCTLSNLFNFWS